jgi:hypothetical protein
MEAEVIVRHKNIAILMNKPTNEEEITYDGLNISQFLMGRKVGNLCDIETLKWIKEKTPNFIVDGATKTLCLHQEKPTKYDLPFVELTTDIKDCAGYSIDKFSINLDMIKNVILPCCKEDLTGAVVKFNFSMIPSIIISGKSTVFICALIADHDICEVFRNRLK